MNGLTPSEQKIEQLIRAHILALGDDSATAGYVSGGPGSVAFQRSELWHEGEKQFLELERCLEMMEASRPKQRAHLVVRYYHVTTATKDVPRHGDRWLRASEHRQGLGPHSGVCSLTGGPRLGVAHHHQKKVTVTERVSVETWQPWVRLETTRRGLAFIHSQFLRDRIEPCVPASVWKAA